MTINSETHTRSRRAFRAWEGIQQAIRTKLIELPLLRTAVVRAWEPIIQSRSDSVLVNKVSSLQRAVLCVQSSECHRSCADQSALHRSRCALVEVIDVEVNSG